MSTIELMERGMNCLLQNLGTIETEKFIAALIRERFDYTKWRRDYFGDASVETLNDAAAIYDQAHPFHPVKVQIKPE